jgi:predicted MFS family arabinose efflux permease
MGGVVADLWSLRAAVWVAAGVSVVSALVVTVRMYETHQPQRLPAEGEWPGDG